MNIIVYLTISLITASILLFICQWDESAAWCFITAVMLITTLFLIKCEEKVEAKKLEGWQIKQELSQFYIGADKKDIDNFTITIELISEHGWSAS